MLYKYGKRVRDFLFGEGGGELLSLQISFLHFWNVFLPENYSSRAI